MSHISHCPLTWMFCSKKSTKKIKAVHERSYPVLLEEVQKVTLHQQCVSYDQSL